MIGLKRDRAELYDRIDRRVDKLFEAGLSEEVKGLMDMGLKASDIAMKGIGYKEIIEAVEAGLPPESASDRIKQSSRRYAKRQMTWLRRYKNMKWFTLAGDEFNSRVYEEMLEYARKETKTP